VWFTNRDNSSIGRITTAGMVTNYTGTGIRVPYGIAAGRDGAVWFTNRDNSSIGRITTAGVVTNYTGTGISNPSGLAAGPDGALWFTNHNNNSIGRITTAGVVTNYTGTGISDPYGIAAGPDGAMWFTNPGNSSIGRITTAVTPKIGSFTPKSGAVGTKVTITGQNLSGATTVAFNGIAAIIVSNTATRIVTMVTAGATTGRISVTTPAGTATSTGTFTVT
jgi:streptogramin lyase